MYRFFLESLIATMQSIPRAQKARPDDEEEGDDDEEDDEEQGQAEDGADDVRMTENFGQG